MMALGGLVGGVVVASGLALAVAAGAEPPEIMVYAAASLEDALVALAPACEAASGSRWVFNFGGSNDLARQILAARKADLFLSADEAWMDAVAEQGLVEAGSRRSLLSNRLVVVLPADRAVADGIAVLTDPATRRIALANPEAVPAGKYARAWLERAGLWPAVRERIVPALDVRAALAGVESGAVDAGVVYRTDAATSKRVRVVHEVAEHEGPRIRYAAALLAGRPEREASRRALDCLAGDGARSIFERAGFVFLGDAP
jgi:molybdate transport system substrate-binding protein